MSILLSANVCFGSSRGLPARRWNAPVAPWAWQLDSGASGRASGPASCRDVDPSSPQAVNATSRYSMFQRTGGAACHCETGLVSVDLDVAGFGQMKRLATIAAGL